MLKHLYIKDFTLIDTLDVDFKSGFSVITGETGAGKSIILGAIGLLLGQRADTKAVKGDSKRCVIEALFDLSKYDMEQFFAEEDIDYDATDCIIRREITAAGKSRAFINDTPVALTTMRKLGEQLVDIHSQHQNLLLNKEDFQLEVVDIIAEDKPELEAYKQAFEAYNACEKRLKRLREDIEAAKKDEDFIRYQYNELSQAKLKDGEQEQLEKDSETMSHAEEIKSTLYKVTDTLQGEDGNGILEHLKTAHNALENISNVFPEVSELCDRLGSSYIELKDIANETDRLSENISFNSTELDALNERLDTIYGLEQKFHVDSVAALLALQEEMSEKLSHIDNSDEELRELEAETEKRLAEAQEKAQILTEKRKKAAANVEKEMLKRLVPLGIPNVRFSVLLEPKDLGTHGADKTSFLFSANTSTPLQPIAQVASGGEIARVMLSLKAMISGTVKLPTIIFDEIDTGVSGKIAEKMANIMHDMGENGRQVLSITHLPQIAAAGKSHYKVYKDETETGTTSHIVCLTKDERINEIAQMLSGSDVTDAAIDNARALLKNNL